MKKRAICGFFIKIFLSATLLASYITLPRLGKNNDALPKGQGVAQAKNGSRYSFSKRRRLTSVPVPMVT